MSTWRVTNGGCVSNKRDYNVIILKVALPSGNFLTTNTCGPAVLSVGISDWRWIGNFPSVSFVLMRCYGSFFLSFWLIERQLISLLPFHFQVTLHKQCVCDKWRRWRRHTRCSSCAQCSCWWSQWPRVASSQKESQRNSHQVSDKIKNLRGRNNCKMLSKLSMGKSVPGDETLPSKQKGFWIPPSGPLPGISISLSSKLSYEFYVSSAVNFSSS